MCRSATVPRKVSGAPSDEEEAVVGHRRAIAIVLAVGLGAGACADKPVTAPRAVVPPTVPSELRAAATVADRFGDMVAIGVGLSNGSGKTYAITADRVLAVDTAGNRVAPLSVTEAARQAGGATALVSGLKGAGGGALSRGFWARFPERSSGPPGVARRERVRGRQSARASASPPARSPASTNRSRRPSGRSSRSSATSTSAGSC